MKNTSFIDNIVEDCDYQEIGLHELAYTIKLKPGIVNRFAARDIGSALAKHYNSKGIDASIKTYEKLTHNGKKPYIIIYRKIKIPGTNTYLPFKIKNTTITRLDMNKIRLYYTEFNQNTQTKSEYISFVNNLQYIVNKE